MADVLDKFAEDVKHFSVCNSELPESQMIEILNKFSNLQTLKFYDVTYNSTEKDDVLLDLPRLRSFEMQLCNLIIPRTIIRMTPHTLQHLSINNCILGKTIFYFVF